MEEISKSVIAGLLIFDLYVYFYDQLILEYALVGSVIVIIGSLYQREMKHSLQDLDYELGYRLDAWADRHEKRLKEIDAWGNRNISTNRMLGGVLLFESGLGIYSYLAHGWDSYLPLRPFEDENFEVSQSQLNASSESRMP